MGIFNQDMGKKNGSGKLPVSIREEVYRLIFGEGYDKKKVLEHFESTYPDLITDGNRITIKASYDQAVSVLEGLYKNLPGSGEALAKLAQEHESAKSKKTAKKAV